MLPHIPILGFKIPSYSLMMVLGIIAFFITFYFIIKWEGISRRTADRLIFVCIPGLAVLGISAFIFNSIFHSIAEGKLVVGGITWLGGVIGVIPFMIFMIHKFVPKAKGNALYYFSLLVPGIVIGHALGRIGCFLGGCCYGGLTDSWLGVSFPPNTHATTHIGVKDGSGWSYAVWPTQLFEALFELVLYIAMMAGRKKFKPYCLDMYLIGYGLFRFLLEFLRGDNRGATGLGLSPSQIMSIILWIGALFLILYRNGLIFKKLKAKCEIWKQEAAEYDEGKDLGLLRKKPVASAVSPLDSIKEMHALKEQGIITEEEFEEKKKELLSRL